MDQSDQDAATTTVLDHRQRLVNVAYRLLGSVADAEDAAQEAFIRWFALASEDRDAIQSPAAWLTTVTSRICLDQLGSARARRERYVGQWIPEPVPDGADWSSVPAGGDPADRITLDESIDMAFLVVLDSMSPAERVAFLLHDVFRYPFDEVAGVVGRTPAACRQLASSARRKVRDSRPVATPATAQRAGVIRQFKQAWQAMDIDALLSVLDPDAVAIADGGGRVPAALEPRVGAASIADFLLNVAVRATELELVEQVVNGQPGLVARQDGVALTVFAFDVAGDRITRIWAVRNPEKLTQWNR